MVKMAWLPLSQERSIRHPTDGNTEGLSFCSSWLLAPVFYLLS